jgi:hypothetical protein
MLGNAKPVKRFGRICGNLAKNQRGRPRLRTEGGNCQKTTELALDHVHAANCLLRSLAPFLSFTTWKAPSFPKLQFQSSQYSNVKHRGHPYLLIFEHFIEILFTSIVVSTKTGIGTCRFRYLGESSLRRSGTAEVRNYFFART